MLPWFQFDTFFVGPIPIRVWGFFVALGMAAALGILWERGGEKREQLIDHALWVIIGGLIGARLFHVIFYESGFYFSHPIEFFKIWHGGLSSFGGLAGGAVGFFLFAKKQSLAKEVIVRIADAMSYAAVFGWLVGRIGCVMIHDHPGTPCNCFLDLQTPQGPKLDMALVEIIFLLPLAILFLWKLEKRVHDGWHTAMLFLYYGALRFILDFFRTGDTRYLWLTPGQFFGILLILIAGYALKDTYGKTLFRS